MGTYPHLLTREKLPSLPGRILSLDTQPNVVQLSGQRNQCRHTLRCGTVICTDYRHGLPVRRSVASFAFAGEMEIALRQFALPRGVTWLCAHNLAYDLSLCGFWELVDSGRINLISYTIDDPPSVFRIAMGNRILCLIDLLNFWRKPLSYLASALGEPISDVDPTLCCNVSIRDLSEQHCQAVASACDSIVNLLYGSLGGGWNTTAAGIAWSAYRSHNWGDRIRIHNDAVATELERLSYSGGRTIAHRIGRYSATVTICDANNLYGDAMHRHCLPIRMLSLTKPRLITARHWLESGKGIIARVRLRPGKSAYPLRADNHTDYVKTGTWTTLAGPDLQQAWQEGRVGEIGECAVYLMGRPFQEYVEFWYSQRREFQNISQPAQAALCKLLTATLFGRLAQKGRHWQCDPRAVAPDRYGVWYESNENGKGYVCCRAVAGLVQRQVVSGEWYHSAVAVSSYVTAYGRQYMNLVRDTAGEGNVLYEDTDCVHVTNAGYDNLYRSGLIHPTRLGYLKIVGRYPWAEYYGVKQYRLPDQTHISGLSPTATEVADGVWMQDKKRGLSALPTTGPDSGVTVERVPYTVHLPVTPGDETLSKHC